MKGIAGKPFINCDEYIDVDKLKSLDKKIILGIAKSEPTKTYFSDDLLEEWEHGKHIFCPTVPYMMLLLKHKHITQEQFLEFRELKEWEQQQWWLHLSLPLRNPSWSIVLRTPSDYMFKNLGEYNKNTAVIEHFPELAHFIFGSLPFKEVGRIVIFLQDQDSPVVIHRDKINTMDPHEIHQREFLYLQPNGLKKFFIIDDETQEKHYVNCSSAFFNELDYHGADGVPRLTYSVRVDGVFKPEFRQAITGDVNARY